MANTKAAWYGYSNAMDGGDDAPGIPGALRNANIEPARREEMLVIDAGPVRIGGASRNADGRDMAYRMTGQFWKKIPVTLGHLRTDDSGRLLVFPGDGVSSSALPQNPVRDFTNNDGWYDDWGDGWVRASVRVGSTDINCDPAWV
ncbi:MAG: LodA/GoxA family CTQ-dependent oxidase, partial [Bradyrhizobium sp.]